MEERIINLDRAISIAKNFNKENIKWHYHLFTPHCSCSSKYAVLKYAVFIESEKGKYFVEINDIRETIHQLRELEELLFEHLLSHK